MSRKEIINGLTHVLLTVELTAEQTTAIGTAIEYLQQQFFNEDASREIDRLTVINEQQAEIIGWQESRIQQLEAVDGTR